jgi:hypothetical protein
MRVTPRCASVALLGVMLSSCAWETAPHDRAHLISEMTDRAAWDDARCQSTGAALGSRAYKECRTLLEKRWPLSSVFAGERHPG